MIRQVYAGYGSSQSDQSKWYPQTWREQMISANLAYINNVILGAIFQSPTCWHFTTTDTVNKFIGKFKGHWHKKKKKISCLILYIECLWNSRFQHFSCTKFEKIVRSMDIWNWFQQTVPRLQMSGDCEKRWIKNSWGVLHLCLYKDIDI